MGGENFVRQEKCGKCGCDGNFICESDKNHAANVWKVVDALT